MSFSDLSYFEKVAVYENSKKIAAKLIKKGISIEIVAEATSLSIEEITGKSPKPNNSRVLETCFLSTENKAEQKTKVRSWFDKHFVNREKLRIGKVMQEAGEPAEKVKNYIKLSKKEIEEINKLQDSTPQNNLDDEYATWYIKLIKENTLIGATEVAQKMKQNSESIEKIREYTKLSKKVIEKL